MALYFRHPPSERKTAALKVKAVMEIWKTSYYEIRETIELRGSLNRWEFDRSKLFTATDHIASVCVDLHHISQV